MKYYKIIHIWILGSILSYCSDNLSERTIPGGHTFAIADVQHAPGFLKAERYCTSCHGDSLEGGEELTPSCYQCHGKNWDSGTQDTAPSSHTSDHGGFVHHPNLQTPSADCSSCHGSSLEGNSEFNRPSCLLCHNKLWTENL